MAIPLGGHPGLVGTGRARKEDEAEIGATLSGRFSEPGQSPGSRDYRSVPMELDRSKQSEQAMKVREVLFKSVEVHDHLRQWT